MDKNSNKPRKKINLSDDFLFGGSEFTPKTRSISNEDNELIRIAALLDKYKIEHVLSIALSKNKDELVNELIANSSEIGYDRNTPLYELRESTRKKYLKTFLNQKTYKEEISRIQGYKYIGKPSLIILSFLKKERINLEGLFSGELTLLTKAARWVKHLDLGYPTPGEIYAIMERKEFLQPLEELTSNFQGREQELKQIKNYVDWLPKEGLLESVTDFFRTTFSWHEKNPMLITGIGGIGKSTLVSKFILDHLKGQSKYPFIYIDFDNSVYSIEEPLFLLLVAFRQLKIQFPKQANIFDDLIGKLNDKVFNERKALTKEHSTRSFRNTVYQALIRKLEQNKVSLRDIDKPILTVFDSFEELQYRGANKAEFNVFMDTIEEISELIPRLRTIFVGRSEIEFKEISFETIVLDSFDQKSSNAYLASLGVANQSLRKSIYNNFGGNPLTLQLAAALAKENKLTNLKRIVRKRKGLFFQRLGDESIQRELVKRNLDHIHHSEVRKIAMPGLLVRKVNPEIIKEVLAEPCGLGEISLEKAEHIFKLLQKETFLIQTSSDQHSIVFRQDLRKAMEDMVVKMDAKNASKIHDNAVDFYKEKTDPGCQAEYVFHRLKRGDEPHFLTRTEYNKISPFLDRSLDELPLESQVHIASLRGAKISAAKLRTVKISEWEKYQAKIIEDGLEADLRNLQNINEDIQLRKERTFNNPLTYWEARLHQRLNDIKKSNRLAKIVVSESANSNDILDQEAFFKSKILLIENLEYQFKFQKAYNQLKKIPLDEIEHLDDLIALQIEILETRLKSRLDIHEKLEGDFKNWNIDFNKNNTYKNYESYYKTLLFDDAFPFNALKKNEFKIRFDDFKKQYNTLEKLESFTSRYLGGSLANLTEPGEYDIIIKDIFNRTNEKIIEAINLSRESFKIEQLAWVLSELYPSIDAVERILSNANIYIGNIEFKHAAVDNWADVLLELQRQGNEVLDKLLKVVEEEYPEYFSKKMNHQKLIRRLAELFPNIDDSKLLLTYAEIDQEGISFDPSARLNWTNIITYIEPSGKLNSLIQVALDESADLQLLEYIKEETVILPMKDASLYYNSELNQDLTELKKGLKLLVSKGKLEDVLEKLNDFADRMDSDDYKNTIVLLFSRLNRLQQEQRQGILSYENYNIEKNKITHSINYQIDQLSEQDVDRILTGLLPGLLSTTTGVNVQDEKHFEKIMGGVDNMVSIEWLYNAVEKSKIVGKIELSNRSSGTGFLVRGGYVLTNHHVIFDEGLNYPQEARLLLDFQNSKETAIYSLDTANIVYSSKELDYALIKINDKPDNPVSDWGYAEFETFTEVQVRDLINIIQHPEGGKKKIAMPDRVISNWKERNYLFYVADTLRGSSGSPVFNQDWKVVALHHAGRNAIEGGFTINADGERRESNRGILIKAIIDDLNKKGLDIL